MRIFKMNLADLPGVELMAKQLGYPVGIEVIGNRFYIREGYEVSKLSNIFAKDFA